MKLDTDEFLSVYDEDRKQLSSSLSNYLDGFASDDNHPLRSLTENSYVGYAQGSLASKDICDIDVHSPPELFPVGDVIPAGDFKAVLLSRKPFKKIKINLGGHAFANHGLFGGVTKFGIIHVHFRCIEIEVENCKRVCERHNLINIADTRRQAVAKLLTHSNCTIENICDTCDWASFHGASSHKMAFYTKWLECEDMARNEYYHATEGTKPSEVLTKTLEQAVKQFDT
ncbi:hypothetical protein ACHAXR_001196 [Thalassiosira sp. AJA248-18]